jgi:predicted TIM-barrel fold metal-dependent hydrolase
MSAGALEARPVVAVRDSDVRHGWRSKADLYPYLDQVYRERFGDYGLFSVRMETDRGTRGFREDALVEGKVPDSGVVASPDAGLTRSQLLDACGIEWALLTGGPVRAVSCHPDLDYGSALARAFNDFTVDHWLSADDRFRAAISVNARDPEGAAKEIERLGTREDVVAVVVPGASTMPYGQRFYRPIHDACARHGLALAIQAGLEGQGLNQAPAPGGYPGTFAETCVIRSSIAQVHLTSLVFEGVFERLPELKVAVLGSGFVWVPAYLWYFDETWKDLRIQNPWVKRPPSEYLLEHVRFGARPFEEPPGSALDDTLAWMQAESTLLYASEYPAWDWQDPAEAFPASETGLRERILNGNATDFFRS